MSLEQFDSVDDIIGEAERTVGALQKNYECEVLNLSDRALSQELHKRLSDAEAQMERLQEFRPNDAVEKIFFLNGLQKLRLEALQRGLDWVQVLLAIYKDAPALYWGVELSSIYESTRKTLERLADAVEEIAAGEGGGPEFDEEGARG